MYVLLPNRIFSCIEWFRMINTSIIFGIASNVMLAKFYYRKGFSTEGEGVCGKLKLIQVARKTSGSPRKV